MKKLAIALTAGTVLSMAAVPASAQSVYIGPDDGYRGYSPRYYSPRADVYVYRDRPYYRRYHRSYDYWTRGPGDD